VTGVLFHDQVVSAVVEAVDQFETVIPIGLFADLIDGLGDPRIAREGGETPGFVT